MYAEVSAECAEDDPVLVVPWTADAAGGEHSATLGPAFVDLREDPDALDQIPEAEQHPALLQALRALNAPRSPVFTAKCHAWACDPDELAALRAELMLDPSNSPHGFASYIDLLWRERAPFVSFHQTEQLMLRLERLAEAIDQPEAALGCVLRPALVDLIGPQEGFAVSLYVRAAGHTAAESYRTWAGALEAVVAILRGREFRATENRSRDLA